MDKSIEYDFEITYVPGVENVSANLLSRIYSNDVPGTVRSEQNIANKTKHPCFLLRTMPVMAARNEQQE